jgi:hypothetical protein
MRIDAKIFWLTEAVKKETNEGRLQGVWILKKN